MPSTKEVDAICDYICGAIGLSPRITQADVARRSGCSQVTVSDHLRRLELPRFGKGWPRE